MRRLLLIAATAAMVVLCGCAFVSEAREEAMVACARSAFCRVHYYFKRPTDKPGGESEPFYLGIPYERLVDLEMSVVAPGLLLDDKGCILVADLGIDEEYVDRIEVVAPDGTRHAATLDRTLDRTTGVLLTLKEPAKAWKAPQFAACEKLEDDRSITMVGMYRVGREWMLSGMGMFGGVSYTYDPAGPAPRRFLDAGYGPFQQPGAGQNDLGEMAGGGEGPSLLYDAEGRPVGAATGECSLDREQVLADWSRDRLVSGPGITFSELRALGERCNADLAQCAYKIVITYRHEDAEDYDGPSAMYRYMNRYGRRGSAQPWPEREHEMYGMALSERMIFVPHRVTREQLDAVEKIEIVVGDVPQPAEFVAAFREIGAFAVRLKDGTLPAHAALAVKPPPERLRLFLTATLSERFGATHIDLRTNRWLREMRGYRDLFYVAPARPMETGSWILDRDLNILGVYAEQRIISEEIHRATSDDYYGEDGPMRMYWTSEVSPLVSDPTAYADPQLRLKSADDARRLPWLGVEYSVITPDLAKMLKVEKPTKDGTIGFYVNLVYKDSPAERLGIRQGAILLRVETPKRPQPIELNASGMDPSMFNFDWRQYADYETVEEYGGAKPRWPIQLNQLTMILQSIGEGEAVKLTWLDGEATVTKDFTIELGPANFLCAPKYRNREIGLTVKDVTYEVRTALRLDDARTAVVVSKIERGSPAEVARIEPFELITAMDGAPIASAEDFGARIRKAQAEGRKTVRLTIDLLGTSRLADLDITPSASAPVSKGEEE